MTLLDAILLGILIVGDGCIAIEDLLRRYFAYLLPAHDPRCLVPIAELGWGTIVLSVSQLIALLAHCFSYAAVHRRLG